MFSSADSPLQVLINEWTVKYGVQCWIKRDDLLHPLVSGNKWRKLKYNLEFVKRNHLAGIISFGGAYSNHVFALSAACHVSGIPLKLYIRGEAPHKSGFTLSKAIEHGASLHFVDRELYRQIRYGIAETISFPEDWLILPEGGSNLAGMKGLSEVPQELSFIPEHWVLAAGTGGSLCGLAQGGQSYSQFHGICVLKGKGMLDSFVHQSCPEIAESVTVHYDYHYGGYAKVSQELVEVINRYYHDHELILDPVYTAKAMLALEDLVRKEVIKSGERVVFIHTGGLQGLWGMQKKLEGLGLDKEIYERL
jgi:1-aminocyclopropane-1-carboxylate deaminase